MTYYILEYPDLGTRYARGGYYEFWPFTLNSLWPKETLSHLREKALRINGRIREVKVGV